MDEFQTPLSVIADRLDGRFIATAKLPLSSARNYWRLWSRMGGKNRYAHLFEQFTTKRPAYRIYLPVAKHLMVNTEFSPVEIDVINALHTYSNGQFDLVDYYQGKVLNRRNGQIINLNKALGMLNEEERKKAISSASPGQIKDKLESATYTIAGQGKGERIKRYKDIDEKAGTVFDLKNNKSYKIVDVAKNQLRWTPLDDLIDKVAADPIRENASKISSSMAVVISRHPYDVASLSTNRAWDSGSCLRTSDSKHGAGCNAHYVPQMVKYGAIVVYGIRADDGNILHPVCRTTILPFVNSEDQDDIVLDISSNSNYGKYFPGFFTTLQKWLDTVNHGNKGGSYKMASTKFYTDFSSTRNVPAVSQDKDIAKWLKKFGVTKYTVREDGRVDVVGDVKIDSSAIDNRFGLLPIKFGVVEGNFKASDCGLKSLKGCPEKVTGDFDISRNQIGDLEHGPEYVGGSYVAESNKKLTTVFGFAKFIGSDAVFTSCVIESLKGIPQSESYVGGSLFFNNNRLRRIDGYPATVECKVSKRTRYEGETDDNDPMGRVDFSNNQILTTVGLPKHIKGDLLLRRNDKLSDLVGFPERVEGHVCLSGCPLRDLSVVENVWIGGTFQFNDGNLTDDDVARFKPKWIAGGCQFSNHYLTKNCPVPPNVEPQYGLILGPEEGKFEQKKKRG